jgi:hypothetical protein
MSIGVLSVPAQPRGSPSDAGLTGQVFGLEETNKVIGFVRGLKAQNITGIFISHNMRHVLQSCEPVKPVSMKSTNICEGRAGVS